MVSNPPRPSDVAETLGRALTARDTDVVAGLLAGEVRWGSPQDTPQTCHGEAEVVQHYAQLLEAGVDVEVLDVVPDADPENERVVLRTRVRWPGVGDDDQSTVTQQRLALQVRAGLIVDICDLPAGHSIELLYFEGCPNHEAYLPRLRALLDELDVDDPIDTIEVSNDSDARRLGFLGSPTLRVDGIDVEPAASDRQDYGLQCRVYRTAEGTAAGTPPDHWVRQALSTN